MGSAQDCDESQHTACQQFCNDDTPPFSKLQFVQDQPAGQPHSLKEGDKVRFTPAQSKDGDAHCELA